MFLQRQAGSAVAHPRLEYCPSMLLKHVWPQDGRDATPVAVGVAVVTGRRVASADEQYALS